MSSDRTPPMDSGETKKSAESSGSKPEAGKPGSPASGQSPAGSGAAEKSSSSDGAKPTGGSGDAVKPKPASGAKPLVTGAGAPSTAPSSNAPATKPAPKTGTAPQPVVAAAVAAPAKAEPKQAEQFRAQPKSAAVSGPPTEAFDPIADEVRGSGAVAAPPPAAIRPVGPRRARLLVTRLDPWSVMKTAFMLAVSLAIVMLVATAVLWYALDATGVFEAIGKVVNDLAGSGSTNFNFASLVGFSRVMGAALIIAALEIVLTSALSTLFAFLYNLSVGLTGGVEVTLSEQS